MNLELQLLLAFGLDLLLGDPAWLPHPVRLIGCFAGFLEAPLRRLISNRWIAGVVAVILVVGATSGCAWLLLWAARWIHPVAGDVCAIVLLYTAFAARDLAGHSGRVYRALQAGDLSEARRRVAMLVGRDTDRLDEPGVVRATVESVAESLVDGVTAPLFFAVLAGPVGALGYKAVNTLDSTFGYKTERYLQFGWASARLDDVCNYLPARLTAPLVALAAALLCYRPIQACRISWRDGRKHESPNAGWSEAAVAGALGVQLGGLNYYGGEPLRKPFIGDEREALRPAHIVRANVLMLTTAFLALLLFLAARVTVLKSWGG